MSFTEKRLTYECRTSIHLHWGLINRVKVYYKHAQFNQIKVWQTFAIFYERREEIITLTKRFSARGLQIFYRQRGCLGHSHTQMHKFVWKVNWIEPCWKKQGGPLYNFQIMDQKKGSKTWVKARTSKETHSEKAKLQMSYMAKTSKKGERDISKLKIRVFT